MEFNAIEEAALALRQGKMVVVVDDEKRENEGDIVLAAEFATTETINFMTKYGRGIVCTPMLAKDLKRLQLPQMVMENTDNHRTAFTVSIDHVSTATGVSPEERAKTIRALLSQNAQPQDFRRPGHVFPLLYHSGGVLARPGHTEASIDLMNIAKLYPASVVCEITDDDGRMMRLPKLLDFAAKHQLKIVTVADLIEYRKYTEPLVRRVVDAKLPTAYGNFQLYVYDDLLDNFNHLAIVKGDVTGKEAVLTRIHSECLTGDVFGSARCDCGDQLHAALQRIEQADCGVVVYMRQEGRGIGLVNKIKAYHLQEQGLDTVEANEKLGFAADLREYSLSAKIIEDLGIKSVCLLTNNPNKLDGLRKYGIQITGREKITIPPNPYNAEYLHTKQVKMGHQF